MKKFTKVCLTLSLVMFLASIGCIIAGLVNSGNPITAATDIIENVEEIFAGYEADFDENYQMEHFKLAGEYEAEELEGLNLNLQVGKVVVKETTGSACRVWIDERGLEYAYPVGVHQENGVVYINDEGSKSIEIEIGLSSLTELFDLLRDDDLRNIGAGIIIEVPQMKLQQMNANIELGAMKIYDLHADKIELNVEAGSIYAEGNIFGDEIKISGGLGDIQLNQVEAETTHLDVEMGNIRIQSVMGGKLVADVEMGDVVLNQVQAEETRADVEMGDMDIEFVGSEQDYDISYDVEMGDVDIASGDGDNENALYKVDLKCEMGNIDITFSDDTV